MYFSPDGKQYCIYPGESDRGKWWIEDDQYCRQWENWSNRDIKCRKFYIVGNEVLWVQNGTVTDKSDLPIAGDTENLEN